MSTSPAPLVCAQCKQINPPGSQYCLRCGEPVAPELLRDAQRLYETLRELDATITRGEGDLTVSALRAQVLARYLSVRTKRPPTIVPTPVAPHPAPLPLTPAAATQPLPAGTMRPVAPLAPPLPVAPPQPIPQGPVFSWRAFIADQAIAIMAYLGGFLLLIATLTFEIGLSALPQFAKLAGVTAVYLVFGALGISLRRFSVLRTVARVYLGVFALMTPLEALAVYLFELQGQGVPVEGMICIASAYAAVVYLALAVRTRFQTYAYLGWGAALAALITIPAWAHAPSAWWWTALTVGALALLAPRAIGARRPAGASAWLAVSALWISGIASIVVAFVAAASQMVNVAILAVNPTALYAAESTLIADAVTAIGLTALAWGWLQILETMAHSTLRSARSFAAWLVAAFAAMSAMAVAIASRASMDALIITIAGVALAEGAVVVFRRARLARLGGLVIGVQSLTMALAGLGMLLGLGRPSPHAAMMVACGAGLTLGAVYAARGTLLQGAPWGVAGGVFALIGMFPAFEALVPSPALFATTDAPGSFAVEVTSLYGGLSIFFALIGVVLRYVTPALPGARNLRAAAHATAMLGSLVTSLLLIAHTGNYAAAILGVFSLAALGVAWIERWPVWAGGLGAVFGVIAIAVYASVVSSGLALLAVAPVVALVALAWYFVAGREYALSIYVIALAAVLATVARLTLPIGGIPSALANFPLAPGGGVALLVAILMAGAALRERSYLWQIAPAAVSLIGVFAVHDLWPSVAITLALAGAGALSHVLRGQRWGIPWHGAAFLASTGALGYAVGGQHSSAVNAVIVALGFLAVAWLVVWQERLPWLTAVTVGYGAVAFTEALSLPINELGRLAVLVGLTLALTGLGALARWRVGRSWGLALYANGVMGSVFTVALGVQYSSLGAYLEVAALVYVALVWLIARQERFPLATPAAALYALVAFTQTVSLPVADVAKLAIFVGLTLALAGLGALARALYGRPWSLALYGMAGLGSAFTVWFALPNLALSGHMLAASLIYLAIAWLIAWQERVPWLTAVAIPFAVVACLTIGLLDFPTIYPQLGLYVALTLSLAASGVLARARLGRPWALALYAMAVVSSLFPLPTAAANPSWAGITEGILLVYAAVALGIALVEDNQWAVLAPALYAAGAAIAQPDGRALLPLALGLTAIAYAMSRMRGGRFTLPLYGAAVVAAVASSWQGRTIPIFEPFALGALALAAWIIAALESRPDGLALSYAFAALTVPALGRAFGWSDWAVELGYITLSWLVSASGPGWAQIPWLRERSGDWLAHLTTSPTIRASLANPAVAGRWISRGAALLIGAGVALAGALAPDSFATHSLDTLLEVAALASVTGLLLAESARAGWRPALYVAIETAALSVTWLLRWFGLDNMQAWFIAPGSAQIVIGALLPVDKRLRAPAGLAQVFSVCGTLLLFLPTLTQSITEPDQWQWVYALTLALEALVLTLIAVGLRNRLLALTGSVFVGVAAIRGAIIAVTSNLPIPIVIGVFALALMGLATWLSLRARHHAAVDPPPEHAPPLFPSPGAES